MLISKGDEFYQNLYDISWHLLPITDQKSLIFIILNSKKSKGLAAGYRTLELSAFHEVNYSIVIKNNLKITQIEDPSS